jgi:DNA invertase Pin-like site-specific DNA recombinase
VIPSIDRLARSLIDLESLIKEFTDRGITVRFLKEAQIYSADTADPMAVMLSQVMGAFAQFERSMIQKRQLEGIAAAKERGTYKGREKVLDL